MKKLNLFFERSYPLLFTLLISLLLYTCRDSNVIKLVYDSLFDATFLTAILTALSIVFGFLLTSFGTIYGSESAAVKAIKKFKRFPELVSYNKVAVHWVFFSVILTSLFLLSYKLDPAIPHYDYFVAVWVCSTIYSVLLSFRFLDLFYVLI